MMSRCFPQKMLRWTHAPLWVVLGVCAIVAPVRAEQSLSDRICLPKPLTKMERDRQKMISEMERSLNFYQSNDNLYSHDQKDQEKQNQSSDPKTPLAPSLEPIVVLPQQPKKSIELQTPKPPITASEHYDRSIPLSDRKEFDERIRLLNRAIVLSPDFTYAYARRARMYTNQKDFDRAIADYDRLRQLDPNRESEILMAQAQIYTRKKQWLKVIQIYDKLITLEPDFIFHHYTVKAQAYAELKDIDNVVVQYNLAIALPKKLRHNDTFPDRFRLWIPDFSNAATEPIKEIVGSNNYNNIGLSTFLTDAELHIARARFYTVQKNKAAALADYQQAIQHYRTLTLVWKMMGYTMMAPIYRERCRTLVTLGDLSAARSDGKLARKLEQEADTLGPSIPSPSSSPSVISTSPKEIEFIAPEISTVSHKKLSLLENLMREGLKKSTETPKGIEEQSTKAIDLFTQAIVLDRNYAPAYYSRGLAHIKQNNFKSAIEDFSEAIRLNPEFSLAYSARASAHQENGQTDQALKDFDFALKTDPTLASANLGRGLILLKQQQWKPAAESFSKTLEADPEMLEALEGRSIARKNLNDLAGSLTDQTRAKRIRDRLQ